MLHSSLLLSSSRFLNAFFTLVIMRLPWHDDSMSIQKTWNPLLYDDSQNYVSAYGQCLLEFFPKKPHLDVLDVGSGTGDLSEAIHKLGHNVVGIDSSLEMVNLAIDKFPHLKFIHQDAYHIDFDSCFDVIFSNETFHWVHQQAKLLNSLFSALRPEGVLICEFGSDQNIARIRSVFSQVLSDRGFGDFSPFYFPSKTEYHHMLLQAGFTVDFIECFSRPTILPGGTKGLLLWMQQFFSTALSTFSKVEQLSIIRQCEKLLYPYLFNGNSWVADYSRLRVRASK